MSIFVGNLPFRAEREDVLQLFAPFGEILNCSLPLERDTGRKRGFAFVEMADESIESTAIEGLQGAELMGRPLRINKAEPRGSGGSRRGGRVGGGYGAGNNSYGGGYRGGNNATSYGGSNNPSYGGGNNASYGGGNNATSYGGSNNPSYGGGNNASYGGYSDPSPTYGNKSSGAEGWEDRSFGNASENSEYESGRSRRRRGISNDNDISNQEN